MTNPQTFYNKTLEDLQALLTRLKKRRPYFGVMRFSSVIALLTIVYFFSQLGWTYVIIFSIFIIILFRWLILLDLKNKSAIDHCERLITINKMELLSLAGEYYQFGDGSEFTPKDHFYANDIDITGHASLYQFCNRTTSGTGGRRLAKMLLNPTTAENITERQQAIKELASKPNWSQELQATGKANPVSEETFVRLFNWLKQPAVFSSFRHWRWLRILLPAIICSITICTIFELLSMTVFYLSLLLFAVIAFQINKQVAPVHELLSKMVNELDTLSASISVIEKENFTADLNVRLHHHFTGDVPASVKLKQIKKLLDKLDIRYNIVLSAPLNLFFLWNLQQVLELENWKKNNTTDLAGWFTALGKFEALNSFSVVCFNNPSWSFPEINENHFNIEANDLGHPLIQNEKRINNYIKIENSGRIMIVTGSNMAGKSTYLRSVGINVVLAMAGAPVCASVFKISPVQLISSMRISDNLEENTSTFYAELKKLKLIIEKVNNKEKVFILLDEILRGTNSLDRHTGSVALVKQLIRLDAAAIIATHDVSLAELINHHPENILNFHFDAQVNNDELYFDYKLKPGITSNLNASMLMKKIGIEM